MQRGSRHALLGTYFRHVFPAQVLFRAWGELTPMLAYYDEDPLGRKGLTADQWGVMPLEKLAYGRPSTDKPFIATRRAPAGILDLRQYVAKHEAGAAGEKGSRQNRQKPPGRRRGAHAPPTQPVLRPGAGL